MPTAPSTVSSGDDLYALLERLPRNLSLHLVVVFILIAETRLASQPLLTYLSNWRHRIAFFLRRVGRSYPPRKVLLQVRHRDRIAEIGMALEEYRIGKLGSGERNESCSLLAGILPPNENAIHTQAGVSFGRYSGFRSTETPTRSERQNFDPRYRAPNCV